MQTANPTGVRGSVPHSQDDLTGDCGEDQK